MIDLSKLRQDAMAATQGEWRVEQDFRIDMEWNRHIYCGVDRAVCFMAHSDGKDPARDEATASHIANLSPSTALALIEAVQKAKAVAYSNGFDAALPDKMDALREALKPFKGK